MDNLTKEQRSYNMSRIRSFNTKLEQKFFNLLNEQGIKYKKYPKIYGNPDCQLRNKVLIFIDSDFWHGWHFNRWKARLPKKYWISKIEGNIIRDKKKFRKLRKMGYSIVRIWGHQLQNHPTLTIKKLLTI